MFKQRLRSVINHADTDDYRTHTCTRAHNLSHYETPNGHAARHWPLSTTSIMHTHTLCSQSLKLISPLFHFICLSAYFLPSYIHFSSLPSLPCTFFCQTHLTLLFFFTLSVKYSPSFLPLCISVSHFSLYFRPKASPSPYVYPPTTYAGRRPL